MNNFTAFFKERRIKKAIIEGRPESIDELFEIYADKLFGYALYITRKPEDAEEVLQNSFLRLVRNTETLKKVDNLKAYFYKSIKNEALNFKRKHNGGNSLEDLIFEIPSQPEEREECIMLKESIGSLPEEQREIVILKVYEGMNFREIASLLEISANTAASRYRYAIEKLKNSFGGKNEE